MFGDRLKLARKKEGFSLRALSEALSRKVSPQAIGKYERNEMMPASDVLLALSKTLGVSPEYLLNDRVRELEGVEFRKKSGTSAKERARVEAVVIDHVQRYLAIEEILDRDSTEWQQPFEQLRRLERVEEAEELADDLRGKWELGWGPLPNVTELLEERGLKVLVLSLPANVSGFTCKVRSGTGIPLPVIVVNRSFTLERRRFTLCHELAHRLIDDTAPIRSVGRRSPFEKAADFFAGAFLVPRRSLIQEIGERRRYVSPFEIIQLKKQFRVAAAAMLMRLKHLGVISDSATAYAFQTYARGWRTQEPQQLEQPKSRGSLELPNRFERLVYWTIAEKLITVGKGAELLQRPVAELKKEIKGSHDGDTNYY